MPTQVHPLLQPKEPTVEEPAAEAATLEGVAPEAPVIESPEAAATEPVQPEPVRRVIDLDAETLYSDIQRYQREDPRFANVFNSAVGRKAAQQYQPQLTKLQADLARATNRLEQLETQGMSEDDLKDRLLKDEGFRQTFGNKPKVAPEAIEMQGQFQSAIAMAEEAVVGVLPPERIQVIQQALYNGAFDAVRDQQGNVVRQLSPQESLTWYSSALHQEAQQRAIKPLAPPPPPPVAAAAKTEEPTIAPPKANTRLAELSPDLTTGSPQTGAPRMSRTDYQALTPPQRIALFPNAGDYESARQRGDIYD